MKYKAIFLGLLIILAFSSTVNAATDEASLGDPKEFLEAINVMRSQYAKEYNVPNMHKLIWSDDLVTLLGNLDWEARWPEARISWRFDQLSSFDLSKTNVEKDINEFLAKDQAARTAHLESEDTGKNAKSLEYVNPLQKFMGCGVKWNKEKNNAFGVCLIGPEGRFTMFDVDGKATNTLGTKCPEDYPDKDGLCTPTDSSKLSFFGSPDTYLDVVNTLRRQYAKEYNVPDMNELVWNDELSTIAKNINLNSLESMANRAWRYAILQSFRSPAEFIERDLKWFIGNDENMRKGILDRKTIVYLELINPKQKLIACEGKWNDRKTVFSVLCLLATDVQASLFDVDNKDPNTLGSKCSEDYQNEDGLCTPIDTSTLSLFGSPDGYLDVVNELRRQYAKEYNVPDMNELIWNDDLSTIAKSIDLKKLDSVANRAWRYAKLYSFRSPAEFIKRELKWFIGNDANMRKGILGRKTIVHLELLNPKQKLIACEGRWNDENTEFSQLCLLSIEVQASILDVDGKDSNTLGSKCSENYQNQDGLCTPIDSSQLSIFASPDGYIDKVNALRRQYAKEYNVPDMHELVWSDDLVQILNELNWANRWPEARITWRFAEVNNFHSPASNVEIQFNNFLAKDEAARQKSINDVAKGTASYLELLNPLQKTFGCMKKEDKANNDFLVVCLLGPEGPKFTMFNVDNKDSTTLGSKCSEGYQNQDGLCTPIDKSKVSQFGSVDGYLDKVNALRKQYAKEYNVPDMYELVWDDDLVKALEPLNWEDAWPEARITWRYARVNTFHSPAINLEMELNEFLAKNETSRQESINYASARTASYLELLNPLQKTMGCTIKRNKKNTDVYGICSVGPEGPKFTMFDVNGKSTNVLRSKCSDPYQNIDGLCAIPPPTTLPPPPPPTSRPVQKPQNPLSKPGNSPQKPEKPSPSADPNALVLEESELNSSVFTQGFMLVVAIVFSYLNFI